MYTVVVILSRTPNMFTYYLNLWLPEQFSRPLIGKLFSPKNKTKMFNQFDAVIILSK